MKRVLVFAALFSLGVMAAMLATGYARRVEDLQRDLNFAAAYSSRIEALQTDARSPDRARSEKALWLLLGEHLAFSRMKNQTLPPDIVFVEAADSYVRLAELANERKDAKSSVALLEDAVTTCKKSKSVNCQAETLLKLVRVLDGKATP